MHFYRLVNELVDSGVHETKHAKRLNDKSDINKERTEDNIKMWQKTGSRKMFDGHLTLKCPLNRDI